MRTKTTLLLLAVCVMLTQYVRAQDKGSLTTPLYLSSQKKFTFAIQPMYLFNWGIRLDFETRLGDGPGWLQFGPAIYHGNKNDRYFYIEDYNTPNWDFRVELREPFSKLEGGGLDINYKRFFDPKRSVYWLTGLSYTRFNIDYEGGSAHWHEYTEDGLPYHEFIINRGTQTQHIDRMGVNALIGFQPPNRRKFLFDMYMGLSYRHALTDKNKEQFNREMISYGYTGVVFVTGIRLGFGLR